jgi:hypothetical protein
LVVRGLAQPEQKRAQTSLVMTERSPGQRGVTLQASLGKPELRLTGVAWDRPSGVRDRSSAEGAVGLYKKMSCRENQ